MGSGWGLSHPHPCREKPDPVPNKNQGQFSIPNTISIQGRVGWDMSTKKNLKICLIVSP